MKSLITGDVIVEAHDISKDFVIGTSAPRLFFEGITGIQSKQQLFQAVKPLSLTIEMGSSVGILGRNGAGKSTLLSLLSGITLCSSGSIHRYGKVAALVGVGQSFNEDLSGRENAARFCRLQGATQAQMQDLIAKIVEFSELGPYFDRPVKTYSSGMKARLNFSCATSVEADLIIIDEVLAVGDAEFRSKCYSRIEASIDRGQTYVMVSHSSNVIGNYCDKALVMEEGELVFAGDPLGAMQKYASITKVQKTKKRSMQELMMLRESGLKDQAKLATATVQNIYMLDEHGIYCKVESGAKLHVHAENNPHTIRFQLKVNRKIERPRVACGWRSSSGIMISAGSQKFDEAWQAGEERTVDFTYIPRMTVGSYGLRLTLAESVNDAKDIVLELESVVSIEVVKGSRGGLVDLGICINEAESTIDESTQLSSQIA